MIKKNLKILIITSVIILLPIVAGLILWNRLPEQVPIHWNMAGEVDGWSSKSIAVFVAPLIMLAVHLGCAIVTSADPKNENHSGKMLHIIFWFIPLINTVISAIIYATAMGKDIRVEMILPILIGLLFVVIGNYLPKCKQNYTIGIKIPWTLNSEENWNRTHRLAGRLWVVCGLVIMLSGFFDWFWLLLAVLPVMVIVPFAYSFILHRKGV